MHFLGNRAARVRKASGPRRRLREGEVAARRSAPARVWGAVAGYRNP